MIAVGQSIESAPFEEFGMPAKWNELQAGQDTAVESMPGVFTGGDCATGPSTAIKAIAAGGAAWGDWFQMLFAAAMVILALFLVVEGVATFKKQAKKN